MKKTATITIAFEDRGKPTTLTIEAEIFGALAVHATPRQKTFWTVTHIETGYAVFRWFTSNTEATNIAMKLGAHPLWKGGADQIRSSEKLKALVNKAMRQYGGMVR